MKKNTGLWIDHKDAILVSIEEGRVLFSTLRPVPNLIINLQEAGNREERVSRRAFRMNILMKSVANTSITPIISR